MRRRWGLRLGVIGAVVIGSAVMLGPAVGIGVPLAYWNTGDSMPHGLYLYAHRPPAAKGEVVVVRDPPNFRVGWLMKRVVGIAGEVYCWRPQLGTHTLGNQVMPPPIAAAAEHGLEPWEGCGPIKRGDVVGYGQSPDSYDSRYLGPLHEADLWGVYRPVWVR